MKQPHQPRIEIIGAASGHGAPDPRCADAPAALRAAGLLPRLRAAGVNATWRATVRPTTANARLPLTAVAQVVYTATNLPEVERVRLLVDGQERDWLRGDGIAVSTVLTPFDYPELNPSSQPDYPPDLG